MSVVIDIADAVAAEINAADAETFSQSFTAYRKVLPEFELADLADLKVTVVPKGIEITGSTRSMSQYDISIDIGIQKKVGKDVDADVAALSTLIDEISEYLTRRVLAAAPWARWVNISSEPLYDPSHLANQRVFTSVLTLTYRALK
jgi:hypothetical protein